MIDPFSVHEVFYHMQIALAKELTHHKKLGQPIWIWQDGEVAKISPEDIKPIYPKGYKG